MQNTDTSSPRPLVLVVEDDAFVRAVAVDALEDEGFEIIEAPSADYAAIVLGNREDISLVFTDVAMPGTMDGFDLARAILAMYPHIPVLIASGALPKGITEVMPGTRFLPKPYRMTHVVQVIREMMAAS